MVDAPRRRRGVLIVVAVLVVILAGAVLALSLSGRGRDGADTATPTASDSETLGSPGEQISIEDLGEGDCFLFPGEDEHVDSLTRVPCGEGHYAEAYAAFELPAGAYPGDEKVSANADAECGTRFTAFIGRPEADSRLTFQYFTPIESSWAAGDRVVTCAVYEPDQVTTGSLRGANR